MVPFAVHLGEWMDIVGYRIGVRYVERLSDLNPHHPRMKPAPLLVDRDRGSGSLKCLSFQSALDIDENVGESAIGIHHHRLLVSLPVVRLGARRIAAHVDGLAGRLPPGELDGSL